jgi:hypothetical protein
VLSKVNLTRRLAVYVLFLPNFDAVVTLRRHDADANVLTKPHD